MFNTPTVRTTSSANSMLSARELRNWKICWAPFINYPSFLMFVLRYALLCFNIYTGNYYCSLLFIIPILYIKAVSSGRNIIDAREPKFSSHGILIWKFPFFFFPALRLNLGELKLSNSLGVLYSLSLLFSSYFTCY